MESGSHDKGRRRVQVQYVMTGMLIYLVMAVDIPTGSLKAIDKIRKDFSGVEGKRSEEDTV